MRLRRPRIDASDQERDDWAREAADARERASRYTDPDLGRHYEQRAGYFELLLRLGEAP